MKKIKNLGAIAYPMNPRHITKPKAAHLLKNLKDLGDISGITWNRRTNAIITGNQRSFKAINLNECEIEIAHEYEEPDDQGTVAWGFVLWEGKRLFFRAVDWDEETEKHANVVGNKAGGDWDSAALQKFFSVEELVNAGFYRQELKWLNNLNRFKSDTKHPGSIRQVTVAKPGDVFYLDKHRIACQDSTRAENWEKILKGRVIDMVLTDPPYNVARNADQYGMEVANDKMNQSAFELFIYNSFKVLFDNAEPGCPVYVFHADTNGDIFRQQFKAAGFHLSQVLIWYKDHFVQGRSDYQWRHEPILYGWPSNPILTDPILLQKFFKWLELEKQIKRAPVVYDKNHEPLLYGWKTGAKRPWESDRAQHTVMNFPKPLVNERHPTAKPVGLLEYYIHNSSREDDLIADSFLGSGSTLIAADNLGRVCYGMDIVPKLIDDTISAWIANRKLKNLPTPIFRNGKRISPKEWINEANQ